VIRDKDEVYSWRYTESVLESRVDGNMRAKEDDPKGPHDSFPHMKKKKGSFV